MSTDKKVLQIVNYAFLKATKMTEHWISPERKRKRTKDVGNDLAKDRGE